VVQTKALKASYSRYYWPVAKNTKGNADIRIYIVNRKHGRFAPKDNVTGKGQPDP
jgi:hypothetical protein